MSLLCEPAAAALSRGPAKPQTHQGLPSLECSMIERVPLVRPPPVHPPRPKNKLLACLPPADFEHLQVHLKTIPLKVKQVLHRRNEPVRHVYFLNGGVGSITSVMKDGAMVEIATVGDEGVLGM